MHKPNGYHVRHAQTKLQQKIKKKNEDLNRNHKDAINGKDAKKGRVKLKLKLKVERKHKHDSKQRLTLHY